MRKINPKYDLNEPLNYVKAKMIGIDPQDKEKACEKIVKEINLTCDRYQLALLTWNCDEIRRLEMIYMHFLLLATGIGGFNCLIKFEKQPLPIYIKMLNHFRNPMENEFSNKDAHEFLKNYRPPYIFFLKRLYIPLSQSILKFDYEKKFPKRKDLFLYVAHKK